MEAYEGVFSVLEELGMSDLQPVFLQHFIQDSTLQYMETEEELKQLLREIEIPLGRCIPIIKLWSKLSTRKDAPDVTQGADRINMKRSIHTTTRATQAMISTSDAETQTYNNFEPVQQYPQGVVGSGYNPQANQDIYNTYQLLGQMNSLGLSQQVNAAPPMTTADMTMRQRFIQLPSPQVFATPAMWGSTYAPPVTEDLGTSGWVAASLMYHGSPIITSVSRDVSPIQSPPLSAVPMDSAPEIKEINIEVPKLRATCRENSTEVLDEREDRAIEQFLVAEEKQQSYASALKETQLAGKSGDGKDNRPRSSSQPQPPSPRTQSPARITSNTVQIKPHIMRPKENAYVRCDEISVESGTSSKVGNSLKNVGSVSLKAYVDQLMASQEYIEATQKRGDPKQGWLAIDGKHILSARKIQFKPQYCDDKGRMRHGVSVRGADKSEECSRHTVGKAPAYCTFAHSRIGDTLQFVCVKCTCEKVRYTFCQDKKKHCEFIFNLGPYRNIEGQVWKLT